MTSKRCSGCTRTLPIDEFYRNKRTKDGYAQHCISCRKAYLAANRDRINARQREYLKRNPDKVRPSIPRTPEQQREALLKSKYGLTPEQYAALLDSQGGLCAICRREETVAHPKTHKVRLLAVDHDHASGRVRGLLCGKCNSGLGLLGDSADGLRAALAYIENSGIDAMRGRSC